MQYSFLRDMPFDVFPMMNTSANVAFLEHNKSAGAAIHGDVIRSLIGPLFDRAAESSPMHFVTARKEIKTDGHTVTVYGHAQCVHSMSAADCHECLEFLASFAQEDASSEVSTVGTRTSNIWCEYRWEEYAFFSGSPLLDLGADTANDHHKKKWWVIFVAVVVPGTVIIAAAIFSVLWWRKRKLSRSGERKKAVEENVEAGQSRSSDIQLTQTERRPSALDSFKQILNLAASKEILLFLDYDGTLAAIVNDPDKAFLSPEMQITLQDVTKLFTTSIVSGRAIEKVFNFVGIKDIKYAGSHGLDIKLSTATTESSSTNSEIVEEGRSYQPAQEHLAAITKVYNSLLRATEGIEGAGVESNKYCISVHYRNVAKEDQARVREVVEEVLETSGDDLKLTEGHMVYEVRPPSRLNKGDAVVYLLENLGFRDPNGVFPIYIGDDKTDEDAFEALRSKECGIGILVSEAPRKTRACYSLKSPAEVEAFLKLLINSKQEMILS